MHILYFSEIRKVFQKQNFVQGCSTNDWLSYAFLFPPTQHYKIEILRSFVFVSSEISILREVAKQGQTPCTPNWDSCIFNENSFLRNNFFLPKISNLQKMSTIIKVTFQEDNATYKFKVNYVLLLGIWHCIAVIFSKLWLTRNVVIEIIVNLRFTYFAVILNDNSPPHEIASTFLENSSPRFIYRETCFI